MSKVKGGKSRGKGGGAKVVNDTTQAGKGKGKATKAIGTNKDPAGGTPDGNTTPAVKKGALGAGKE